MTWGLLSSPPSRGVSAPAGIPHSWKKAIHQAPACKFHSVQVSKTPIFLEAPGSLCSSGMYFTGFTWEKDLKPQGFNIADYNWSGNKKHLDMEASHFTLKKKRKKKTSESPFLTALALLFLGHDTQESSCCLLFPKPFEEFSWSYGWQQAPVTNQFLPEMDLGDPAGDITRWNKEQICL